MKNEQERDLYFMADIHGSFKEATWIITQQHKLNDANIVFLGDVGIGFAKPGYYNQEFERINAKLEKNNITYYFMRGNHDNLRYWKEEGIINEFPRIKFLKDHEVIELSGKTIYLIGGATSVDYEWRRNYNELMEKVGSSKRIWWETEDIEKKTKDLPRKVDIIVSHTAPLSFDPVITRFPEESEDIYNRDLENRKYLDYIFREVRCKNWFFGHFHTSITSSLEDTIYKCLDINELYMFRS
jgi:UDP-2,3-diacylglucosamine pyrophosphatase LpxH